MDSSNGPALVWSSVVLVSLLASLFASRLKLSLMLRYAAAWVLIFGLVTGVVMFRSDLARLANSAGAALGLSGRVADREILVNRGSDGHFHLTASINGASAEFLIDSGASVTTVNPETAAALAIADDRASRPVVVETANGIANSWPTGEQRVTVDGISVDGVAVDIGEGLGDTNLLGMSFLNRLQSWTVEGDRMRLRF